VIETIGRTTWRKCINDQTIAAIGFAVVIVLLIPVRLWIVPRMPFSEDELDILDGPVASPFVSVDLGWNPAGH
jgi:hypothetical protein